MKYIVIAPDAITDNSLEELDHKTPLEACKLKNLQYLAKNGKVGRAHMLPDDLDEEVGVGMFSVLGYDPDEFYTGAGPLQAARMGIKLEQNEVAFCCNFVTESEGELIDATAGHITTKESRILINHLNKKLSNDYIKFFAGEGHQHVVVIKDSRGIDGLDADCFIPQDVVGKQIKKCLPKGSGAEAIQKLMFDSQEILKEDEINQVRLDLKENPANLIWLWGQGVTPQMPKFMEKYGLTGGVITASSLVKGIGRLIGLTVVDVPGATGLVNTDYDAKAKAALAAIEEKDFVLLHISSAYDASENNHLLNKVQALESLDKFVLEPVRQYIDQHHDTRLLIVPSQLKAVVDKKMDWTDFPFVLYGKNIVKDEIDVFTEEAAKLSALHYEDGFELMSHFIGVN